MAIGRPKKAAQSPDEALTRHYAGQSPKRPRNQIERDVMRKSRGRTTNPNSPTRSAAQCAAYLVHNKGLTQREAARRAAEFFGLKADSIRKPLRKILAGPTVTIKRVVTSWAGQTVSEVKRPLLASVDDVP